MPIFSSPSTSADADLLTRIGIAFSTRPRIAWHEIHVTVQYGIVMLRGDVTGVYDRQLIVAVTRHVAGVFGVDDQLTVGEADLKKTNPVGSAPARQPQIRQSSSDLRRIGNRNGSHHLRACFAMLAVVALMVTGCGKGEEGRVPVHPVIGAIQFRGQPVVGAFVALHPMSGQSAEAPGPRATVGPGGAFSLTTYDGDDGAPEGEYTLTVQWYRPVRQGDEYIGGPNVLPQKYSSPQTSGIKIQVAAGENRLQPIQLR